MPTSPLKILIVEDADMLPELMKRVIMPLLSRFPGSTVTTTASLMQALQIIAQDPPPDVVTLDLTLSDSSLEQTLQHVEEIDDRAPVVVVTGGAIDEEWKKVLEKRSIEVIDKSTDWLRNTALIQFIVRAFMRRRDQQKEDFDARLTTMRKIHEELSNASFA